MPKVIKLKLIFIEESKGEGTEKDPARLIESYYLLDGTFVASYDKYKDESYGTINFFDVLRELKS